MQRFSLLLICCLFLATAWEAHGQDPADKQAKIQSAMSAGPSSISADATIKDHDGSILREGTNGWTCYPDMPDHEGHNPMCLDQEWEDWWNAYLNKETPNVTQIGIGYMQSTYGSSVSNTDPFAEGPAPDNEWIDYGEPHLMVIVPDLEMYEDLPSDPSTRGPYVMWRDTPYAHLMVPTK